VAGGDSGEEAAWRDLIANYAAEPEPDSGERPWPERENLTPPRPRGPRPEVGPDTDPAMLLHLSDDTDPSLDLGDGLAGEPRTGDRDRSGTGSRGPDLFSPGGPGTGPAGTGTSGTGPAGTGATGNGTSGTGPAGTGATGNGTSGNGAGGHGPAGHDRPGAGRPGDPHARPGRRPAASHRRVIRPARPGPPPGDDDADFVPPVPPPLPSLDPVAKAAWTALFAGPGYLLIATVVGWVIPGWAAFLAVAAFVGGFATLVIRMGDKPPRDSGPDDGAVV